MRTDARCVPDNRERWAQLIARRLGEGTAMRWATRTIIGEYEDDDDDGSNGDGDDEIFATP